ncbi:hypothetical protein ACFZDJ_27920 [Streptomyces sp. NPDC007896]|uniref:hypothetical protein n=1 Tax=Streptomyces sp. NPDC007896 TaxID=3364784 RepID=UPI0036E47D88
MTDAEWAVVRPLLPVPGWMRGQGRQPEGPDRQWRRRGAGVLMALGLLASASVLFRVGSTDAFNALAYGGRVMGVAFLTAALVEAVATLAVCDYWGKRVLRYSGAAILVGVGTVTVTNLMFLFTQIQGRSYTPFLWLWITLVLWAAWAFWLLTRQKARQGVPHPKGVALSVVVSGVAGIASLAYSQMYVPYSTPVSACTRTREAQVPVRTRTAERRRPRCSGAPPQGGKAHGSGTGLPSARR